MSDARQRMAAHDGLDFFLMACTQQAPGRKSFARDLYKRYAAWCAEQDDIPMSAFTFSACLSARGFARGLEGNCVVWQGLGELEAGRAGCSPAAPQAADRAGAPIEQAAAAPPDVHSEIFRAALAALERGAPGLGQSIREGIARAIALRLSHRLRLAEDVP